MQITINDVNLYYEKKGNKRLNILILPGWGNTRKTFNYMIEFLSQYATVYILDFPGWGKSSFPNRNLTIYDYGYLVKDFIKILNIDNPIIIGHSFGVRVIAILVGYLNLDPKKLIIINGAGIKRAKSIYYYIKILFYKTLKFFKFFLKKEQWEIYLTKLSNIFGSSDYNSLTPNMKKTFSNIVGEDLRLFFKNITQETLILWGDNDQETPLKDGKAIEKLVSLGELITLKNTGHFSYIENPVLINNIIYEFIKEDI